METYDGGLSRCRCICNTGGGSTLKSSDPNSRTGYRLRDGVSTCRSPTRNQRGSATLAAEFFPLHYAVARKFHLIAAQVENGCPYCAPVLSNGPSFIFSALLRSHLKFILCNSTPTFSTGRSLCINPRDTGALLRTRGISRR